jgi:hypothetical protein
MRRLAFAALCTLVFGIMALPAPATPPEPIGPFLSVLVGTQTTFPAGTSFHTGGGWGLDPNGDANGKFSFSLQVDGVLRNEDFVDRSVVAGPPEVPQVLSRIWVYNFASGLSAGSHTFVGHWFGPCYATAGPCVDPNSVVEIDRHTLIVSFF